MAISKDRVKISEITKSNVNNFQKQLDTPFEKFDSLRTTGGDSGSSGGSFFDSLTESINGVTGKINDNISGINKTIDKGKNLVNEGIVSVLQSDTSKSVINLGDKTLGVFNDINNNTLPNIKARYDDFVNQNRDLFDNINKVGDKISSAKSQFDNVLGSINKVTKKADSVFGTNISGRLNNIVNSKTDEILGKIGYNKTSTMLNGIYNNVKSFGSTLGGSASDKTQLLDILQSIYCDPGATNLKGGLNKGIQEAIFEELIRSLGGDCNPDLHGSFSNMRKLDKLGSALGVLKSLTNEKNTNILKQIQMVSNGYTDKNIDFEDILKGERSVLFNPDITQDERSLLQTDSSKLFDNISKLNLNNIEDKTKTFKDVILTASIVDKNWNKDDNGNTNVSKLKNDNMKYLAESYLSNNINTNLSTSINTDSMGHTGYDIAIVNQFNKTPIMRV